MHPITEAIKSIIRNTQGYSIEILVDDLSLNSLQREEWINVAEAVKYSKRSRMTIFRGLWDHTLKGAEGRTKKSYIDEWLMKKNKKGGAK